MDLRPIDANALLKVPNVRKVTEYDETGCGIIYLAVPVEEIDKAPTLDVWPVRHGTWKYYHKQNKAICLSCSFERDLDADFGKAISCPNCGAKMDGGSGV